jgi:transposase
LGTECVMIHQITVAEGISAPGHLGELPRVVPFEAVDAHKTLEVKKRLLRHPRFHPHFTPTSSSWTNLLERWFAELTNRELRRPVHRSVTELEADIRKWINEWNNRSKPFV